MPLDPKEGLFEFRGFKGLRNNVDIRDFDPGDLEIALNMDVDDAEDLDRRKGFSAVVVADVDRDLFAVGSICLGVGSNTLKQILPNLSTVSLLSGLTPNRPLSYAAVADRVYWSNGVEKGVFQNGVTRSWGIVPPTVGAVAITGGALRAGRYQISMTYLRQDGQESGAALAAVVELTAIGGFTVALPVSTDTAVSQKAVYLSTLNGEILYRYAVLSNGEQSFSIREERKGALALATQFLSPPPAGEHIAYANGRMLVAVGNRLYPSEPYAPEWFDLRKGVPFIDRITLVAPLEDGTWLGTDTQIVWLPNAEPEKWEFKPRANYGIIPGTAKIDTAEAIGEGTSKLPAVFFATASGLCAGLAGGQLVNFTDGRFAYPIQPIGAGVVRSHLGGIQYLVTLKGPETAGNVFV